LDIPRTICQGRSNETQRVIMVSPSKESNMMVFPGISLIFHLILVLIGSLYDFIKSVWLEIKK
jgi:hypothetical protein